MEIYSKTRTGDKQTSFETSGRGNAPEAQNANWREHINALWETRPCYFCHKQIPIFLEIQTNTTHPGFCSGLALNVTHGSVSIYPRYKQENLSAKICSLAKAAQQLLFRDLLHKNWHIHKIYTRDLEGGTNWRRISLKKKSLGKDGQTPSFPRLKGRQLPEEPPEDQASSLRADLLCVWSVFWHRHNMMQTSRRKKSRSCLEPYSQFLLCTNLPLQQPSAVYFM